MPGTNPASPEHREGHLGELLEEAGLTSIEETTLVASLRFASFDDWWEPFTLGVGPAGAYTQALDAPAREELRVAGRSLLPTGPVHAGQRGLGSPGPFAPLVRRLTTFDPKSIVVRRRPATTVSGRPCGTPH